MLTHFQERPDYTQPIYAPDNGHIYGPDYLKPETPHSEVVRLRKEMAELLYGKTKTAPGKTPYTNSYVRSFDGALMVEIGSHGFVSETWAVRAGLLHDRQTAEAATARKEARKARKARKARRNKTRAAKRIII